MEYGEGKMEPGGLIEMTTEQKRAQKFRNIAIGLALAFMVGVFYVGSYSRVSSMLGERAAAVAADIAAKEAASEATKKESN